MGAEPFVVRGWMEPPPAYPRDRRAGVIVGVGQGDGGVFNLVSQTLTWPAIVESRWHSIVIS